MTAPEYATIKQIIVLKESRHNEGRVALIPNTVANLSKQNWPVMVESEAGKLAGFTDGDYRQAGAQIIRLDGKFPPYSLILRVKCPTAERKILENTLYSTNSIMLGFLDPLEGDTSHIDEWKSLGIAVIPLELLPLSPDDPKNAQSAMSHFAGRLALLDALKHYHGSLAKKVTVVGTGPAGMGAALTAKKLELPVQLFGRRERYRKSVEGAGIHYYVLPESDPRGTLRHYLDQQTIVITAARTVGKKAPLLIDKNELAILPDHAVIVDLSAGEGGSVIGSKSDQLLMIDRNICIINVSGYPKAEPREAATAFANCMVNLLLEITTPERKMNMKHFLLKDLWENKSFNVLNADGKVQPECGKG